MKKWICLSLLLLLCKPAHALTAAQIITTARVYLGDQASSPTRQQFTDATLLSFINDGQREANAINWLMMSTYTFVLSGGTTEYALPSDFIGVERVLFKNTKIDATSLNELDAQAAGWKNASGAPIKYYLDYFSNQVNIGFYPAPTTVSTGTATIYYVQQPTELTSSSQSPWNGWPILAPYHSALAYYVAFRCYLAQEDSDMAPIYQNEWNLWLGLMRQGLYKQPDFSPGVVGRRQQ